MCVHKFKDDADSWGRRKVAEIMVKESSERAQQSTVCKAATSLGGDSVPPLSGS